ncbi:MAG: DUF1566 domain-containing protein [Desulfobacterales bacterium]|nr:DUF1566 domain-containing protein [Desulfobacterales bacterium]MDJ0886532.1 DUF1566 domain-containing protein [Desulfobacterales bacterium]
MAASILPFFFGCAIGMAAEIVATDGNLVRESTGAIYDTDTGLEWYPGPDRGMTWEEARNWVAGLAALGGGWRMPERNELGALRRTGDGVRNLTQLIPSSGYWFWAGQTRKAAFRWVFGFGYGGEGWSGQAPEDGGRTVAVRIRARHH